MKQSWLIRPYKDGDEKGIFELKNATYPSKQRDWNSWLRWWYWMHRDNPAGVATILVADDNGTIVGHDAFIPMHMKAGDEVLKIFHNIDLMVHPDYRRQGIYSTLEKHLPLIAEKQGVNIFIGFPNEAAYPGHMKSGWLDLDSLQIMAKPLNIESILKTKINNKFLRLILTTISNMILKLFFRTKRPVNSEGITISRISYFDNKISEFYSRISQQYPIMLVRDMAYLNWRYGNVPDVEYTIYTAEKMGEIHGYLVLRSIERGDLKIAKIYDIVAQSEQALHALISKSIEYCNETKQDLLFCALIANNKYYKVLRKSGFIFITRIYKSRFNVYTSSKNIRKAFLKESQNWFVQTGDSDAL